MRHILTYLTTFRCLLLVAAGIAAAGAAARDEQSAAVPIGQGVPDCSLRDTDGREQRLRQIAGKRATIIVFVSTECPMSNAYLEPLVALATDYEPRGANLLLINANDPETASQVAAHAKEFKLPTGVLKDAGHSLADLLGAQVTPEAFLLDGGHVLRYRGRIDNRYASRLKRRDKPGRDDLREALEELLAGQPVSQPETEPLGCPIARMTAPKKDPGAVTFNRDVATILQEHCQTCHRPGQAAPFALMNYSQAAKWGSDIGRVTHERIMPPWKPLAGAGEFRYERRLTDAQIATIAGWVQAGMPEGDPADLPPPREFSSAGWQLGEPDLVLTMPQEYEIHANGRDIYRQFVMPTDTTEDRWVSAVEFHPGNPRVTHHATFFLDTTGRARRFDEEDPQPGFGRVGFIPQGSVGAWAMGSQPTPLPDGVGMRLPRGADVVVQVHYHPSGKPERDRSTLGVYFAKKPVRKLLVVFPVVGFRLAWPAGEERIVVTGQTTVPVDAQIVSVLPHMHLLGKEFKMSVSYANGTVRPLIHIKEWDFNWQETYVYKNPIPLPKGTRVTLETVYDNSDKNPNNPNNPPQPVYLGEQATDEMCIGFLGCTVDDDTVFIRPRRSRAP